MHGGTQPKPPMPEGDDPRAGHEIPGLLGPYDPDPLWMVVLSWVHAKIERYLH